MFKGTPPILRVALRHRKWAMIGACLASLTFLYCLHHPEYRYPHRRDSSPTNATQHHPGGIQSPSTLSPYPHDVLVIQLVGDHEFPDYNRDITCADSCLPTNLNFLTNPYTASPPSPLSPPQQPSFSPEIYTKALVIAHTLSEPVDWISSPSLTTQNQNQNPWTTHLYTTDSLSSPLHTPLNKGRESLVYLTYIIENYHSLPSISVFMHAHSTSWHDDQFGLDSLTSLSRLNLSHVIHQGYSNLRCKWDPGCPDHIHPFSPIYDEFKPEEFYFLRAWGEVFPWKKVPEVLSQPCCGQFALSRERILSVKLAEYVRLRDWLLLTELDDGVSGRVFEYIWQVIWTGEEVVCRDEGGCYCSMYGICFGEDGGKDGYGEYREKKGEWEGLNSLVEEFVDRGMGFAMEDVETWVERVNKGEGVEDVVLTIVVGEGEGKKGGEQKEKEDETGKEKGADKVDNRMTPEQQELAERLKEVIEASRKAGQELLPWLEERAEEAKKARDHSS